MAESLGVGVFEVDAQTWTRQVGVHCSVDRSSESVEQHLFDPDVVVEVFDVPQGLDGTGEMEVGGGSAVGGERDGVGRSEGGDGEEAGDAAAAGGVGLEDVDGLGVEHGAEVEAAPAVLAGGDVHAGGPLVAKEVEAREVVGADGLFEPGDAELGMEAVGEAEGLLFGVGAVGIDEQLGLVADGFAGGADAVRIFFGVGADFDFDAGDAVLDPALELLGELGVGVGGESAGAVDGCGVARLAEEMDERLAEEFGLEVPERHIDGGEGGGSDAGGAVVASELAYFFKDGGYGERGLAIDGVLEQVARERRGDGVGVGVSEAVFAAGFEFDEDQGCFIPAEGAVGLGGVGGDGVGRGAAVGDLKAVVHLSGRRELAWFV